MVKYLMENFDICYFCEHWLGDAEEHLFNDLCAGQSTIFSADFENIKLDTKRGRGRSYGGRCWVIRDGYVVKSFETLNRAVTKLLIVDPSGVDVVIYGVWQPFDNGSSERLGLFLSTMTILQDELMKLKATKAFIIGDFNADLLRGNRFDKLLKRFVENLDLLDVSRIFGKDKIPTYHKGSYKATIDHFFCNKVASLTLRSFDIIYKEICMSDHKPVACIADFVRKSSPAAYVDSTSVPNKNMHKFPWSNNLFISSYKRYVSELCLTLKSELMDKSLEELAGCAAGNLNRVLLKAARKAEVEIGLTTRNGVKKRNMIVCANNQDILDLMNRLRILRMNGITASDIAVKDAKKSLRKLQRLSIFNRCRSDALNLDNLLSHDRGNKKSLLSRKVHQKKFWLALTDPVLRTS